MTSTLRLYRAPGGYRWLRRDPAGRITAFADRPHAFKVAAWRACRRANPDHPRCRVIDITFTWWPGSGPANLSRPPITLAAAPRRMPSITEARKRL